jgi:hypothetical protein
MPLTYGLADLMNVQNPYQQKKPTQNKLGTTLPPQSPVQSPTIQPSIVQPSISQPIQKPIQQNIVPVETIPKVETPPVETPPVETPPVETPPVETPPVETPPPATTPEQTPSTGIDWSTSKVEGTNLSVNDWFAQNSFANINLTAKRKEIQDNTFEEYWKIIYKDTSWFDDYWSKDIIKRAFLQGPDAIAALFFSGAENGKFGIDAGDLERARGTAISLYGQMRSQMAQQAPDESTLAESGATPKVFYDDQGRTIAQGYQLQDGRVYIVKDLRRMAGMLDEAQNTDVPTLTDFMNEKGYNFENIKDSKAWNAIQGLIDKIQNPETQEEWLSGGLNQAGRILGLGNEAGYQQRVGGLAALLEGGISGQQGFTPEEKDLQDRQFMSDIKQVREETKLIIESLGASGRSAQALVTADNISSQIANTQIQYRLKIAEQNYARQQAQFDSEMQQYQFMVQTGQLNVADFIQKQRENAAMQLAVYGQEISMIESANAQYLQEYSADLQGLRAHTEAIYTGIMAELGLDTELRQQIQDMYNSAMVPYTQMLQDMALMREDWAYNNQQRMQTWSVILGMIGAGAQIVAAIASGTKPAASSAGTTTASGAGTAAAPNR